MHEIDGLDLSGIEEQKLLDVGFDTSKEDRAGSFIIIDGQVKEFKPIQQGIEVVPLSIALEKYDWLKGLRGSSSWLSYQGFPWSEIQNSSPGMLCAEKLQIRPAHSQHHHRRRRF
jgi:hypothetical protein